MAAGDSVFRQRVLADLLQAGALLPGMAAGGLTDRVYVCELAERRKAVNG